MEWNPSDTVTVGGIFVGFIILFLGLIKMVGKRTDPMLADALKAVIDSNTKRDGANEKSDERWASLVGALVVALEKNTTVMDAISGRIALSETNATARQSEMMEAWRIFRGSVTGEHNAHNETLALIVPAIERLSSLQSIKIEQSEGLKQLMGDSISSQEQKYDQILAALNRIERGFEIYKQDSAREVAKLQAELDVVKDDIGQIKPIISPAAITARDLIIDLAGAAPTEPKEDKTEDGTDV